MTHKSAIRPFKVNVPEEELVDLTLLVVALNGWNRINVAARAIGGNYRPAAHA